MGLLLLFDSFVLTMQSETVVDLALNLTALHFIQDIDDQAFNLAQSGMLSKNMKQACDQVTAAERMTTHAERHNEKIRKRFLILLMTISLLAPYGVVVKWQRNGIFICSNLYIQFGDAFQSDAAHYSGDLVSQGNAWGQLKEDRTYYLDGANKIQLAYCKKESAWTISLLAKDDPCDYFARSSNTDSFDVLDVADMPWLIKTDDAGDAEAEWMKIFCNDCNRDRCNPAFGTCSGTENKCECIDGRFGINCEFKESCKIFGIDETTKAGIAHLPEASYFLDQEYASIDVDNATLYDFPIYAPYDRVTDTFLPQVDSCILFTGRRWIFIGIPEIRRFKGVKANWTFNPGFIDYFSVQRNTSTTPGVAFLDFFIANDTWNYFPLFYSSPVDYGRDTYKPDLEGLDWVMSGYRAPRERDMMPPWPFPELTEKSTFYARNDKPISAKLQCIDCVSLSDLLLFFLSVICRQYRVYSPRVVLCETISRPALLIAGTTAHAWQVAVFVRNTTMVECASAPRTVLKPAGAIMGEYVTD